MRFSFVAHASLTLFCLVLAGVSQPLVAQAANSEFGAYPPPPTPEPLTETVHGVVVRDPYRWMEKPERRAEMLTWINASSAQTTEGLAKLPGRASLLKELQEASRAAAGHWNVQLAGGRMFFMELAPNAEVPVLKVREDGQDRLLLDPMTGMPTGTHRTINNYATSPAGKLVAVHMADGGGEVGTIRFYDVLTGKPLEDTLMPIWGEFPVNWIDETTITYTRMNSSGTPEQAMENMTTYLHHLRQPTSADVAVLGPKVDVGFRMKPVEFPMIWTPRGGSPWAFATANGARADRRVGYAAVSSLVAGKPRWTPVADYDDHIQDFDVMGNTLLYLTTGHDSNGEVRSLQLGDETLATSKQVLPGNGKVLTGLVETSAGLYITTMAADASNHLLFLARGSLQPVDVPMPFLGSFYGITVTPDRMTMLLGVNGIEQNLTYYRVDGVKLLPTGLADTTLPSASKMAVIEETATSADGTKVPLTITAPKGPVKPLPTLLRTYASYGISAIPYYSPENIVWVTRGGVIADCHARGGGEKGRAWHEAGRSSKKVNAMADVIACGERLVQLGYTTSKLMGLWSESAGGLVVTPVGLKRPDLFAAIVTSVGLVNASRLAAANNGSNQFAEMGDPNTDEGFKALASQDSTLLLADNNGGTSQLFTIGLNDHRVDPWMSAKLVAMMRAKWGNKHLVLMRSDADAGHGVGSSRDQSLEELADIYAFLLNRFGQPGFTIPE